MDDQREEERRAMWLTFSLPTTWKIVPRTCGWATRTQSPHMRHFSLACQATKSHITT